MIQKNEVTRLRRRLGNAPPKHEPLHSGRERHRNVCTKKGEAAMHLRLFHAEAENTQEKTTATACFYQQHPLHPTLLGEHASRASTSLGFHCAPVFCLPPSNGRRVLGRLVGIIPHELFLALPEPPISEHQAPTCRLFTEPAQNSSAVVLVSDFFLEPACQSALVPAAAPRSSALPLCLCAVNVHKTG